MGASNTKPKPITIACYVPKVKGFCRLFTLSRDEWTFEALIKEIRKFYPEFNGMVTAKGISFHLLLYEFLIPKQTKNEYWRCKTLSLSARTF